MVSAGSCCVTRAKILCCLWGLSLGGEVQFGRVYASMYESVDVSSRADVGDRRWSVRSAGLRGAELCKQDWARPHQTRRAVLFQESAFDRWQSGQSYTCFEVSISANVHPLPCWSWAAIAGRLDQRRLGLPSN